MSLPAMTLFGLPEHARKHWLELLRYQVEDGFDAPFFDLAAHYMLLQQSAWISDDGSEVRTEKGTTWLTDHTVPYPRKP